MASSSLTEISKILHVSRGGALGSDERSEPRHGSAPFCRVAACDRSRRNDVAHNVSSRGMSIMRFGPANCQSKLRLSERTSTTNLSTSPLDTPARKPVTGAVIAGARSSSSSHHLAFMFQKSHALSTPPPCFKRGRRGNHLTRSFSAPRDSPETIGASTETSEIERTLRSGQTLKLILRKAIDSDMDQIRKTIISEWLNPFNLEPERFWVLEGGPDIGIIGFCQFETIEKDVRELRSMVVRKEYRGQGMGTAMMRAILEEGREKERPIYVITAGDQNCAFYKNVGFQVVDDPKEVPIKFKAEKSAAVLAAMILRTGGGYCLRLDG